VTASGGLHKQPDPAHHGFYISSIQTSLLHFKVQFQHAAAEKRRRILFLGVFRRVFSFVPRGERNSGHFLRELQSATLPFQRGKKGSGRIPIAEPDWRLIFQRLHVRGFLFVDFRHQASDKNIERVSICDQEDSVYAK